MEGKLVWETKHGSCTIRSRVQVAIYWIAAASRERSDPHLWNQGLNLALWCSLRIVSSFVCALKGSCSHSLNLVSWCSPRIVSGFVCAMKRWVPELQIERRSHERFENPKYHQLYKLMSLLLWVCFLASSRGFSEFSGFSRTLNHTPNHNSTTKDDQEPRKTINLPLPKPTLWCITSFSNYACD